MESFRTEGHDYELDFDFMQDFRNGHGGYLTNSSLNAWGGCMELSVPEANQLYTELPPNLDHSTPAAIQWSEGLAFDLNGCEEQNFSFEPLPKTFSYEPQSLGFEAQPIFAGPIEEVVAEFQPVAQLSSPRSSTPISNTSLENPTICKGQRKELTGDDEFWKAVSVRSRAADRLFIYGVQSTKVYCRPSCPSRKPARRHVRFFSYPGAIEAAEKENFRACKRCKPNAVGTASMGVLGVGFALQKIADEIRDNSSTTSEKSNLKALAQEAGLSMFHFHRLFKAVTLMTPIQYTNVCHLLAFQDALGMDTENERGAKIIASLKTEDLSHWNQRTARKALGGITPLNYSQGAENAEIWYTPAKSTFGTVCVAWSKREIAKCCCRIRCRASVHVHALLLGMDAESRIQTRFPAAKASNIYTQWLLQCIQELGEEGRDRETELPESSLPSLRRSKVWSRIMQDPVLGEFREGVCNRTVCD